VYLSLVVYNNETKDFGTALEQEISRFILLDLSLHYMNQALLKNIFFLLYFNATTENLIVGIDK